MKAFLRNFTSSERLFVLAAMLCSFLISCDYAAIRPVSSALFITSYGSDALPYAWLATVPLNLLLVALYNKYLPRLGCLRMFFAIASAVIGINLFAAVFIGKISSLPFLFFVWKEVYILLMFQQLWSVIHSSTTLQKAKYLYGIFFGVGALGALCGSILPSFFAVKVGSESLLFATLPIYILLGGAYALALRSTEQGIHEKLPEESAFWHGMKLIGSSRYLRFILVIVVLMQISASLIDFQFNAVLEKTVLEKDLRTEYTGRIFGMVHAITLGLQFVGSFLLVHFVGLTRSHLLIPCLLCLNSLAFLFFPLFGVISFVFVSIKACDFSLFGVLKEMLYIPLQPDEKFRAKAFIDVFAHRTSKALASCLILVLQLLLSSHFLKVLNWSSIFLFVLWGSSVVLMFRNSNENLAQGKP